MLTLYAHLGATTDRVEFMTALCQLAINRYVLTKQIDDVSDSISRLLEVDLRSQARTMHEPDDFRRRVCYRQDVTELLGSARVAPILRDLYESASNGGGGKKSKSQGGKGGHGLTKAEGEMLNLTEWKVSTLTRILCVLRCFCWP